MFLWCILCVYSLTWHWHERSAGYAPPLLRRGFFIATDTKKHASYSRIHLFSNKTICLIKIYGGAIKINHQVRTLALECMEIKLERVGYFPPVKNKKWIQSSVRLGLLDRINSFRPGVYPELLLLSSPWFILMKYS